ncbi:MAG: GGDEF domain-containing protein [Nitrospiria bacterium]
MEKKKIWVENNLNTLECKDKCQRPRLLAQATHDDLTGVYNRRSILRNLDIEIRRAFRHRYALSILIVDLDYFRKVNDIYGGAIGDSILREAARRMREMLREEDFLGRYGGDEFIVILPHTALSAASIVATRLITNFSRTSLNYGKIIVPQTLSIGISGRENNIDSRETLLKRAEYALYLAKEAGGNTYKK